MQSIKFIGIDLSKSVFQLALADTQYHVIKSLRLSRSQFKAYFNNHPPVHIIMETCGTAHYWGRIFNSQGHQVCLLPLNTSRRTYGETKRIIMMPSL